MDIDSNGSDVEAFQKLKLAIFLRLEINPGGKISGKNKTRSVVSEAPSFRSSEAITYWDSGAMVPAQVPAAIGPTAWNRITAS